VDRRAYRAAVATLTERGIVEGGRLTAYGADVEAMPVERPWGELVVHADAPVLPYVAVAANIESLHRMTRDERDLRGLVVHGSDHLTGYNLYAEAVNLHGELGSVYGLPRHLFRPAVEEWAASRGVLVKALEDVALGLASVYRTLEAPLPASLPAARGGIARGFRDLLARVMPFDLVISQQTARGEPVRVGRGSFCAPDAAVAGEIRYFADRFGTPRGAIEGTELPFDLIRRYAVRHEPVVRFQDGRRHSGLVLERATAYHGFELEREREPLTGGFPADLADRARLALAEGLVAGTTPHPDQHAVAKGVARLDEYWRRSGGELAEAGPDAVASRLAAQLRSIESWEDFLTTRLRLDPAELVDAEARDRLDRLPSSVPLRGDRIAIHYGIERGEAVARLKLREGKARRVRAGDLPPLDRPFRFSVIRGGREVIDAASVDELEAALQEAPRLPDRRGRPRRRIRRRGR
jgi:hypothetical protein